MLWMERHRYPLTLRQRQSSTPQPSHPQGTGKCPGLPWAGHCRTSFLYRLRIKKGKKKIKNIKPQLLLCNHMKTN